MYLKVNFSIRKSEGLNELTEQFEGLNELIEQVE